MPKKTFNNKCTKSKMNAKVDDRKTKEIETALALQRQNPMILSNATSQTLEMVYNLTSSIPGFYYDSSKQRYFKRSKFVDSTEQSAISYLRNIPNSFISKLKIVSMTAEHSASSLINLINYQQLNTRMHFGNVFKSKVIAHSLQTRIEKAILCSHTNNDGGDRFVDICFHPLYGYFLASEDGIIFHATAQRPQIYSPIYITDNFRITSMQLITCSPINRCDVGLAVFSLPNDRQGNNLSLLKISLTSINSVKLSIMYNLKTPEKMNCIEWDAHNQNYFIGGDGGIAAVPLKGRTTLTAKQIGSSVFTVYNYDPDSTILGLRNGNVALWDHRCYGSTGLCVFAVLPSCVDQVATLDDKTKVVALDMTGYMALFDIRYPRTELVSITSGSKILRKRRFFIPPSPDDSVVIFGHPSISSRGIGAYSLRHSNTLLNLASHNYQFGIGNAAYPAGSMRPSLADQTIRLSSPYAAEPVPIGASKYNSLNERRHFNPWSQLCGVICNTESLTDNCILRAQFPFNQIH